MNIDGGTYIEQDPAPICRRLVQLALFSERTRIMHEIIRIIILCNNVIIL